MARNTANGSAVPSMADESAPWRGGTVFCTGLGSKLQSAKLEDVCIFQLRFHDLDHPMSHCFSQTVSGDNIWHGNGLVLMMFRFHPFSLVFIQCPHDDPFISSHRAMLWLRQECNAVTHKKDRDLLALWNSRMHCVYPSFL